MSLWRAVLVFVYASAVASPVLAAEAIYKRTAELPSVRITYSELQSVLDKSVTLFKGANSSARDALVSESLNLKHGELQVSIPGHQLQGSHAKLPKVATRLNYTVSTYPSFEPAAVKAISFDFSDTDRQVSVEGTSPEQVDAVFAVLKSDLNELSSLLGGRYMRQLAGVVIFMLCALVVLLGFPHWLATRKGLLPMLFAIACITILFTLPFDRFLAGFSVSDFDPAFVTRYGGELSLLSVLVSLVAIPLSALLPIWFGRKQTLTQPQKLSADVLESEAVGTRPRKGKQRRRSG